MTKILTQLFLIIAFAKKIQTNVIGVGVIPHGDFAFDPSLVSADSGAKEVHEAALSLGDRISTLVPDYVLLTSPHGQALDVNFVFYGNDQASGFAPVGADLHDPTHKNYKVSLEVKSDSALTLLLERHVRQFASTNVSVLTSWGGSEPSPLRWGEVLPLSFLNKTMNHTKFIVLSMPSRRYKHEPDMVDELLRVGGSLFEALDALSETVMMVCSSDLAHTHRKDGPYGYSKDAVLFDEAIRTWATTPVTDFSTPLLSTATKLADTALSCGFTGLVMLQGFMTKRKSNFGFEVSELRQTKPRQGELGDKRKKQMGDLSSANVNPVKTQLFRSRRPKTSSSFYWKSGNDVAYAAPTYYGMIVASWWKHPGKECCNN